PYDISADEIPVAFNCFMNVTVDGETGELSVEPPKSKAGDTIRFKAQMDLIIGLTACSAPQSNNGSFKPIEYEIGEEHIQLILTIPAKRHILSLTFTITLCMIHPFTYQNTK